MSNNSIYLSSAKSVPSVSQEITVELSATFRVFSPISDVAFDDRILKHKSVQLAFLLIEMLVPILQPLVTGVEVRLGLFT